MERGYVKLWRKTLDSGLLAHPKAWQVFGYLLLNAAWKPTSYATVHGIIKLVPGQLVTGRHKMAGALKMSEQNIRTALAMLANLEIIAIESTKTHSTITFKNWAVFQGDQPSPNQQPTNAQPTLNQHLTTVKEGKQVKKKEQPWEACADFVSFWRAWPRSVRKGSPVEAYKAWLKASPPLEQVLATLAWKKRSDLWTRKDENGNDFILGPAKFLNNAGWLEENPAAHKNDFAPPRKPVQVL